MMILSFNIMKAEELKELAKSLASMFNDQLNDCTICDSPSEFPDFALRCIKEGLEICLRSTYAEVKELRKVEFEDSDFPETEENEY
jgi:hypothetical protein